MECSRREFLRAGTLGVAAAAGTPAHHLLGAVAGNPARLARRKFGTKPDELSIIGFGGIVVKDADQNHANRIVASSVERGVNYFDVAPGYGDAEAKLGPALAPYRKSCFLACKTMQRTAAAAEAEFNRSLSRLRTDYFDLYQLHAITDVAKDVDAAFATDGAMKFLAEARNVGRVRYLGFSAHSIEAARAALDRFEFDSVLFPVNFAAWMAADFGPQVLKLAEERGAARLALKALARQRWTPDHPLRKRYSKCWYEPLTDRDEAGLALRFTLGQSVTAAIPPGDEELFRLAVDLAMNIEPLDAGGERRLARLADSLRPIFPA